MGKEGKKGGIKGKEEGRRSEGEESEILNDLLK